MSEQQQDIIESYFQLSGALLKARPATEGDERIIYCEPSTEDLDSEGERVLKKALVASAPYFLRFGNLDIEHRTLLGAHSGFDHPELYEIGQPLDVKDTPNLCVKGRIYRGEGEHVEKANFFWKTLTEQDFPRRWYPSVGGAKLAKARTPNGETVISKVRWSNLGFAKEPINTCVKAVSLMPLDAFAKALVSGGYATDAATFTGGRALQPESLEGKPVRADRFHEVATRLMKNLGAGMCEHLQPPLSMTQLVDHMRRCEGLDAETARQYATRLIRDAARRVRKPDEMRSAA